MEKKLRLKLEDELREMREQQQMEGGGGGGVGRTLREEEVDDMRRKFNEAEEKVRVTRIY